MDQASSPAAHEAKPVFVDATGRRRAAMHLVAALATLLLVALLGSTVAAVAADQGVAGQGEQPRSILTPLPGGGE